MPSSAGTFLVCLVHSRLLLLTAVVLMSIGCQSGEEDGEERGDLFFKPLTVLPPTSPALVFSAEHRASDSLTFHYIDSLQNTIEGQQREIRGLREEVRELRQILMMEGDSAAHVFPPAEVPAMTFEAAAKQFQEKNYRGAIRSFRGLLDNGMDTNTADDAQLFIAQSFFHLQQYHQARAEAEKVLLHEDTDLMDAAQFLLGQCLELTGNNALARKAFEAILRDHPHSRFAAQARQRLTILH